MRLNILGLHEYTRQDLFIDATDEVREADRFYIMTEADKVIAEKDEKIRRLRRALFKACENWAHIAVAFFSSYVTKDRWRLMERKCRAKAEEYK